MKKTYLKPTVEVYKTQPAQLLSGSDPTAPIDQNTTIDDFSILE